MANYDYTRAFAQNGQKTDIDDVTYKGGWFDVVGGLNGIPTVQQFNTIMNEMEGKTNDTHELAVATKNKVAELFNYDSTTKTMTITTKAD